MMKRYLTIFLLTISAITTQAQWTALSGPPGGDMKDIEVDGNNKLYTITAQKIFTSTNDGANWTQLVTTPSSLQVDDILVDGTALYAVNYSSFYKSDDGGANWTRLNSNSATGQFYGVEYLTKIANNTFAIYGWNGVYVTSDGGVNWTKISSNRCYSVIANNANDLFIADQNLGVRKHPFTSGAWSESNVTVVYSKTNQNEMRLGYKASNNTIFVNTYDNIYKSTDGFATAPTSIKNAVITDSGFGWCRWTVAPDGKVYFGNHSSGVLYVSANDGTSWTALAWPASGQGNPPYWKIIFTSTTKAFAATAGNGIFKTTDSGVTWAMSTTGINLFRGSQVEIAASGRIIVSENYSKGFWYSDNAGSTWTFKAIGSFASKIVKLPFGTPNTLISFQGDYYSYSTNNGDNWTTPTSYIQDITFNTTASASIAYAVNGNVLYSTTNASVLTPVTVTGLPAGFTFYNITEDDAGVLYSRIYNSGTSKYEVYKIVVSGATGTATKLTLPLTPDEEQYGNFNNLFVSDNKVYFATGQYIYYSSDQGSTWGTISFSHSRAFGLVDGVRKGICASASGTLYVTQDDGQSWASFSLPTTGTYSYINDIAVDGSGDFYGATYNSPALKNTASLLIDPTSLPPYISFNWEPANGPYGGNVREVFVDDSGNTYALRDGYLYKTSASFTPWQKISDPYNGWAADFVIDRAASPDKIYALYWNEIRTSIDGGASWSVVANSENITGRENLVRSANGNLVMSAYSNNGFSIYISANGGTSFGSAKMTVATGYVYDLLTSTTNGIILRYYDSGTSSFKLVRSIDGGTTWPEVTFPTTVNDICRISADANGNFYAIANNNIYKSADNGTSWNSIKGDYPSNALPCTRVFASGTNLYIFGGTNNNYGFYKSTNGGTNWVFTGTASTQHLNINDITWQGTRMVVATENGIVTTDNDNGTYTERNTGIPINVETLELTTPQKILAGGWEGCYSYNLSDWTKQPTSLRLFFRTPNGRFLACNWNEIYESTDNGTTWTKIAYFANNEGNLQYLVTQDGTTFFAGNYNKLYYTTSLSINNNQTAWTEFSPSGLPGPNDRNIQGISVDPSGIIFISLYNLVSQAYEAYQVVFGTALRLNQIINPRNIIYTGGKTIIYDGNGSIFASPDGSSFSQRAAPGGDKLIITEKNYYFIPVYPGNLWLSRDEGQTWQQVGLNNTQYYFKDIVINEYNGYAYASIGNSEVRKSANIVIPDDGVPPAIATLAPANNATNIVANTTLTITFDEVAAAVAAKKVRIFESTNQITPVEEILATNGVQNGKAFTFTLTNALTYLKTYIVTFESGAFRDIFGNAHPGILNPTTWRFTVQDVPDATAPSIAYTQANFIKGQANSLSITATDNAGGSGINPATVKLFYRKTMSAAALTEVAMPNTSGSTYQISIPDTWVDELGLEFYFTAADVAGNEVRSPSGTGFHNARISHTEGNEPTIPSGFIGVGGKAGDYRMFSIPYDLQNGLVGVIFDELGASDKTLWRIVQYVNSSNSYTDASSISRGTGYWINAKTAPSTISVEGASTPNDTKTTEFQMALKPGWNLIGNPYPFTINWSTVKAGNVAIGDAKSYNGSFVTDNTLSPFEAAFVFLNGTQNTTATIPFAAKSGRLHDPSTPTFDGLWLLPLSIENRDMKNDMGGVGMHEQAASGLDQFDDVALPRLFDFPEIHFVHPEATIKNFTRDIVPVKDEFEWHFTADVEEGHEATLTWNWDQLGKFDKELFLLDESTQTLVSMLEQNHYSFLASKNATFKVYYGADLKSKIRPTSIMLGKPYPNPTQSSSSISFTLPDNASGSYHVVLDVYDLVGNKITTLTNAQLKPGFHTTRWSPEQREISAGLYIYKLMVNDHSNKKIMTEKLLIQK